MVYWDVIKESFEVDDMFKWKVIIEMKSFVLYVKQCVFRDKIGCQMLYYDNLVMIINCIGYRCMKKQNVCEVCIIEKFEKQQCDVCENCEKKKYVDFLQVIYSYCCEIFDKVFF